MNKRNNYHYQLDLPVNYVPKYLDDCKGHSVYPLELLDDEFVNWFRQFDIGIGHGEEFILDPEGIASHIIHIDGKPDQKLIKLNYVYCDTPHVMNWYKIKEGRNLRNHITKAGTPYLMCEKDDCELVHSAQVGKPSLVNVSELHDVSTVHSMRYCFSFVLTKLKNGIPVGLLTWEEAEQAFEPFMVNT